MALHKPVGNSGRGFVHTYRLINGGGYHIPADSDLHKWVWLTKGAGLCCDVLITSTSLH